VQGCTLAAAPLASEAETATSDVAPSGAWDLLKTLAGQPPAIQMEATRLEVATRQQQLKAYGAEEQRGKSERNATIGVLEDLWSWQHDPVIGDLLVYVKAGGDPGVAMQAAAARRKCSNAPAGFAGQQQPQTKPQAQWFATSKERSAN
jgi:hypothetical protein